MFNSCELLTSLPDISKWNTQNVTDMKHMFICCESLISLPNISKWNTQNVNDMSQMFADCKSLTSLPIFQNGKLIKYMICLICL